MKRDKAKNGDADEHSHRRRGSSSNKRRDRDEQSSPISFSKRGGGANGHGSHEHDGPFMSGSDYPIASEPTLLSDEDVMPRRHNDYSQSPDFNHGDDEEHMKRVSESFRDNFRESRSPDRDRPSYR